MMIVLQHVRLYRLYGMVWYFALAPRFPVVWYGMVGMVCMVWLILYSSKVVQKK